MSRNNNLNNLIEESHDYGISYDTRELFVHGSLSSDDGDPGVDWRMSNKLLKNLRLLEKTEAPICIHQYSMGGEWESGMMMYDAVNNSSCFITVLCHGATMSMATVILQAADLRASMPNCVFMIHEGSIHLGGTHKQGQAWAAADKKNALQMLEIFANRCAIGEAFQGKSKAQIKKFLQQKFNSKEDWIITAEEALYYGIIDEIVGENRKYKNIKQIAART